jgi:hypothetical protein
MLIIPLGNSPACYQHTLLCFINRFVKYHARAVLLYGLQSTFPSTFMLVFSIMTSNSDPADAVHQMIYAQLAVQGEDKYVRLQESVKLRK